MLCMYTFCEFIVVYIRNRDNNTLKINKNIALNKDDDIRGSQIPVMWQSSSITIPLAKQAHHLCKIVCMPSSFVHLLELLMYAF